MPMRRGRPHLTAFDFLMGAAEQGKQTDLGAMADVQAMLWTLASVGQSTPNDDSRAHYFRPRDAEH